MYLYINKFGKPNIEGTPNEQAFIFHELNLQCICLSSRNRTFDVTIISFSAGSGLINI